MNALLYFETLILIGDVSREQFKSAFLGRVSFTFYEL